jgi:chemotaxis protein MotB
MLTLLLVLFIVMYAIGATNISKFTQLKTSLATAFNNGQPSALSRGSGIVGGGSANPAIQDSVNSTVGQVALGAQRGGFIQSATADQVAAKAEADQFTAIKKAIAKSLKDHGLAGAARFVINEKGLVITVVTDKDVFAGNSAVLEHKGKQIINAVIPQLRWIDNNIELDGYTNQLPGSTAPYQDGWDLSAARAASVLRYLSGAGRIPQKRMSVTGYSDQHPLLPPSDPGAAARNRRVEIVVLTKLPASARSDLQASGLSDLAATDGGLP